MTRSLTAVVLIAALAGCGGGEQPVGGPDAAVPVLPRAARPAVEDLMARLDVDRTAVRAVAVERVTWNDGSLGCTTDDEMYSQATVEGRRITLEVDGETYEYHSGRGGEPFLCTGPTE